MVQQREDKEGLLLSHPTLARKCVKTLPLCFWHKRHGYRGMMQTNTTAMYTRGNSIKESNSFMTMRITCTVTKIILIIWVNSLNGNLLVAAHFCTGLRKKNLNLRFSLSSAGECLGTNKGESIVTPYSAALFVLAAVNISPGTKKENNTGWVTCFKLESAKRTIKFNNQLFIRNPFTNFAVIT